MLVAAVGLECSPIDSAIENSGMCAWAVNMQNSRIVPAVKLIPDGSSWTVQKVLVQNCYYVINPQSAHAILPGRPHIIKHS